MTKKPKFTAKDLFILESAVLGGTVAEVADLVGERDTYVAYHLGKTRAMLIRMCAKDGVILKYKRNRTIQHDAMNWIEAINRAREVLGER